MPAFASTAFAASVASPASTTRSETGRTDSHADRHKTLQKIIESERRIAGVGSTQRLQNNLSVNTNVRGNRPGLGWVTRGNHRVVWDDQPCAGYKQRPLHPLRIVERHAALWRRACHGGSVRLMESDRCGADAKRPSGRLEEFQHQSVRHLDCRRRRQLPFANWSAVWNELCLRIPRDVVQPGSQR